MYSLGLIIFVISEKKAFEHFPIGSNVNLCIAVALYTIYVFYPDWKSKMAATTIHRLTLDPIGKCSNAFFSKTSKAFEYFPIGYNVNLCIAVAAILDFRSA
jgi:hypothetical protein